MKIRILRSLFLVSFIHLFSETIILIPFNVKKPLIIITNEGGEGRLGDQIITYSKTKWLSHKYQIPFYLIPFKKSEKMELSGEQCYTHSKENFNKLFNGHSIRIDSEDQLIQALKNIEKPTHFIVHFYTRLQEHTAVNAGLDKRNSAWTSSVLCELTIKDQEFGNHLKKMLQPLTFAKPKIPTDKISVAIHIRKGGGFDRKLLAQQYYDSKKHKTLYELFTINEKNNDLEKALKNIPTHFPGKYVGKIHSDKVWLDKFPPEQYYVDQIKKLSELLNNIPLYVYIFTDDTNPKALTVRIKKKVNNPSIEFACKLEKNSHDTNVIHDYFAMTCFDCLIRSGSGFGYIAQLAGNHKIVFYPLQLSWHDPNLLTIDKVGIINRTSLF